MNKKFEIVLSSAYALSWLHGNMAVMDDEHFDAAKRVILSLESIIRECYTDYFQSL